MISRRIASFKEFINEQEDKSAGDEDFSKNLAKEFVGGILNFGDGGEDPVIDTPESKARLPYTSCGKNPYPIKFPHKTNSYYENLFKSGGLYYDVLKYQPIREQLEKNSKKLFLVGLRNRIDVKRQEGDKFIDAIGIIDPSSPDESPTWLQATTCPSLAFYGDRPTNPKGIAILQPGAYNYHVGIHREGTESAHEALRGDDVVVVERYEKGTKSFDTYHPGNEEESKGLGINIHKSSNQMGICVGAYSIGCQVIADGDDFNALMKMVKESQINNKKIIYCLVELDDLKEKSEENTGSEDKGEDNNDREGTHTHKKIVKKWFPQLANEIKKELENFDTDEDNVITMINNRVKTSETMSAFADFYQKKIGVGLKADLSDALDDDEMAQIKFLKSMV